MKLDTRNKLLLGGLCLTLFLGYHLAIKRTIRLRQEVFSSQEQREMAKDLPKQLHKLSTREREIDTEFEALNLGTSSVQNDLIKFLNQASMDLKVKIIELGTPHIFQGDNAVSKTHTLNLEGSFNDVLQVVYALEQHGGFGSVSHFALEKHKNYRNGKSHLQALVFLELME